MNDLIERLRAMVGSDMVPMEKAMNLLLEAANALETVQKDVMRAHDLEVNWFRCSRACASEQTKRKQAEARAERLAEALRVLADAFESRMADDENPDWHECWNNARALLREQETGRG